MRSACYFGVGAILIALQIFTLFLIVDLLHRAGEVRDRKCGAPPMRERGQRCAEAVAPISNGCVRALSASLVRARMCRRCAVSMVAMRLVCAPRRRRRSFG